MDPMDMDDEQEISEEDPRPFGQRLPTRLLNERGKRIVNADPDLRADTVSALLRVHPPKGTYQCEHRKGKDHPVLRRWNPNDVGIIAPPPKKGKTGEEVIDPIALELLAFEAPPRKRVKVDANGRRLPDMGNMSFEEYKRRQREGIERARAEGRIGKKPKDKPDNFEEVVALWREKKISTAEGSRQLGVCNKTFLKWAREKN